MKLVPRPSRDVSLTVRIQRKNKEWLTAMANETNRSKAEIMDELLTEHRGSWVDKKRKTTRGTIKKSHRKRKQS